MHRAASGKTCGAMTASNCKEAFFGAGPVESPRTAPGKLLALRSTVITPIHSIATDDDSPPLPSSERRILDKVVVARDTGSDVTNVLNRPLRILRGIGETATAIMPGVAELVGAPAWGSADLGSWGFESLRLILSWRLPTAHNHGGSFVGGLRGCDSDGLRARAHVRFVRQA